jgi:hypothetical protein
LDARNGTALWERGLSPTENLYEGRLTVTPLEDGDALVIEPPEKRDDSSPWLAHRISGTDGTTVWRQQLTGSSFDSAISVPKVDERNSRAIVFFTGFKGNSPVVTAYDLRTGAQGWQTGNLEKGAPFSDLFSPTLAENGDIDLWGRNITFAPRYQWQKGFFGLWYPKIRMALRERPVRVTLSGGSGAVLKTEPFGDVDEQGGAPTPAAGSLRFFLLYTNPIADVVVVDAYAAPSPKWRILPAKDCGLPIHRRLTREPGGETAKLGLPGGPPVVTPSGRIAVFGSPDQNGHRWQIIVW